MALREELRAGGERLFRRRSVLPLPLLAVLLVELLRGGGAGPAGAPARAWIGVGFAVALLGLGVRLLTTGCAPPGTSGRGRGAPRADLLNTTGPYSVVRHPLYLGNFLMWVGASLAVGRWWFVALVVLAFALVYERIMLAEEEFLRSKFGEAFTEWADRTPAVLPRLRQWRPPSLRWSFRAAVRGECSGILGLVVTFAALAAAREFRATGRLAVPPFWAGLLAATVTGFLAVVLLRRTTRLLDDPPGLDRSAAGLTDPGTGPNPPPASEAEMDGTLSRWTMPILRIGMGLFLLMWGIDKLAATPGSQGIFARFYGVEAGPSLVRLAGWGEILLALALALGLFRVPVAWVQLVVNGISTGASWRQILDPWGWIGWTGGGTHLFLASIVIMAASVVLVLNARDDTCTLDRRLRRAAPEPSGPPRAPGET